MQATEVVGIGKTPFSHTPWYRDRQMLSDTITVFILSRGIFVVAATLGMLLLPEAQNEAVKHTALPSWIDMFWRWDAIHYRTVAYGGYTGPIAFFPLFPILLNLFSPLLGATEASRSTYVHESNYGFFLSGIIIPNLLFLVACLALYRLVVSDSDRKTAKRAVFYLSISPMSLFFVVPYSESLFLATSIGCFYFLRRHQWLLAGVCGLLASLTRQFGILLVLPFLVEFLQACRQGRNWRFLEVVQGGLGLLLIPSGLGLFMLYLQLHLGDPLAFLHAQDAWGRQYSTPWTTISDGIGYMLNINSSGSTREYLTGLLHGVLVLSFVGISVISLASWRSSYSIYTLGSIFLILSSHLPPPLIFQSMGRYVLVLFPVFFSLARWGRRQEVHLGITACSIFLFALCVALYVRWYPIG